MGWFVRARRRFIPALLSAMLLLTLTACTGGNSPDAPHLVLNGKRLHVYTSHYFVKEDYIEIPLQAFLTSIGAEYADSSLNAYGITCYSFMGKRYIVDEFAHLFMLEDDYVALAEELNKDGKQLSRKNAAGRDLFSENENELSISANESGKAEIWADHVSLMNALRKSGVDITIDFDSSTRTITVDLPEQGS